MCGLVGRAEGNGGPGPARRTVPGRDSPAAKGREPPLGDARAARRRGGVRCAAARRRPRHLRCGELVAADAGGGGGAEGARGAAAVCGVGGGGSDVGAAPQMRGEWGGDGGVSGRGRNRRIAVFGWAWGRSCAGRLRGGRKAEEKKREESCPDDETAGDTRVRAHVFRASCWDFSCSTFLPSWNSAANANKGKGKYKQLF